MDLAHNTPIAEPNPGGIYARLEELGHRLDHFDEEIHARMPAPEEVRTLQLASGVAVIELTRTTYDTEGRAVEVCATVMAADAYVLAYQLPATDPWDGRTTRDLRGSPPKGSGFCLQQHPQSGGGARAQFGSGACG